MRELSVSEINLITGGNCECFCDIWADEEPKCKGRWILQHIRNMVNSKACEDYCGGVSMYCGVVTCVNTG
ncbi:hypothetical protein GAMM_40261 [Gammaproteobacteria bacterium]